MMMIENNLRGVRESRMMSKAELARKAGISPITLDRVEQGMACRLSTMRKILEALEFDLAHRQRVFPELS